jgi:hypothetical protein
VTSLADAINVARFRRRVPPFVEGSTHDLASKLGLASPISVQNVIGALDDLLPAGATFTSGSLAAGNVHASASLYVQSDGSFAFAGRVHEFGAFGDNFLLTVTMLDVKDAQGRAMTLAHADTVVGELEVGFSNKDWHTFGTVPIIERQWEQARTSRVTFTLHVATDPWQVTEGIIVGVLVAVGSVFLAHEVLTCPEGEEKVCGWTVTGGPTRPQPGEPDNPPSGGSATYHCECRPKR